MKAVIASGSAGDLKPVELEKPVAGPGQVLVRISQRTVHNYDTIHIEMKRSELDSAPPTDEICSKLKGGGQVVAGCEGLGFVEQLGSGVTRFAVGQRVVVNFLFSFTLRGDGSWQEYVAVPEEDVFAVPESLADGEAAQIIANGWTAYSLFKELELREGQFLLLSGASAALGRLVIQLAKHWGIKAIGVVRRDDVKEELKQIGAHEVINSTSEEVEARVKEITGGEFADHAVDLVGGDLTRSLMSSVRQGGRLLIVGFLSGRDETVIRTMDLFKVKIELWILMFSYLKSREIIEHVHEEVSKLLDSKVLRPSVGKSFKLEDFREAIAESRNGGGGRKTFLCS